MRFSIIVPVYNVEKYLKKCLDSVVKQRFSNYEVIIVDDETPDNSMAIAQKYVDADPERFRIIHQKNKGLGGARNTGVAAAKGEYVLFLDSDDYIHEEMLTILDRKIQENPCDIPVFNFSAVSTSGEILSNGKTYSTSGLISSSEEKKEQLLSPPNAWNKCFLRTFYIQSNVSFPEKLRYEDIVIYVLLAKAKQIQTCTESLYYYVQRSDSIMNSQVSSRVLDIIQVAELVREMFIQEGLYADYKDGVDAAMIKSVVHVASRIWDQVKDHPYQQDLVRYVQETYPDYLNNQFLGRDTKDTIYCLARRSRAEYRWRVLTLPKMKSALIRVPFVKMLHQMRKSK